MGEREFVLLVAALMGTAAFSIDTMIPAFAAIREAFDLAPDSTQTSLTITLFFFGNGMGFFLYGPLADSVGRKRVIHLSLGLYGLAALAAALAPSLGVLYAARFVWGFASAGPRILSQAILRDRFEGTALARAMTLAMTVFYIVPIAAPIIGRGILEVGGWRWVFGSGSILATLLIAWSLRIAGRFALARSVKDSLPSFGNRSPAGTGSRWRSASVRSIRFSAAPN
jgi:DHA1 family bicyclomycin/chloramphenicol resistance-like MFS transporter